MDFELCPPEFGVDVLVEFPAGSGRKVRVYNLPTLHGGKTAALIKRVDEDRLKGRDFLDYLFHVRARTPFNASFFKASYHRRAWENVADYDNAGVLKMLKNAFEKIDYGTSFEDADYYAIYDEALYQWNREYFLSTLKDFAECPFIYPEHGEVPDAQATQAPGPDTPDKDEDEGPRPGF